MVTAVRMVWDPELFFMPCIAAFLADGLGRHADSGYGELVSRQVSGGSALTGKQGGRRHREAGRQVGGSGRRYGAHGSHPG